jgi:broad specificity phosphatase PhoE
VAERHDGGEAVAVSHMTPILVARLFYEGSSHPPWRAGKPCARASVTTLTFEDGEFAGSEYLEPG